MCFSVWARCTASAWSCAARMTNAARRPHSRNSRRWTMKPIAIVIAMRQPMSASTSGAGSTFETWTARIIGQTPFRRAAGRPLRQLLHGPAGEPLPHLHPQVDGADEIAPGPDADIALVVTPAHAAGK